MKKLLGMVAMCSISLATGEEADSLYVDYSRVPNPDALVLARTNILSLDAEVDFGPGKRVGNQYLAYLSVVEVAPDASYAGVVDGLAVPTLATNAEWGGHLLDITRPQWREFLVKTLAAAAVEKGFDGFFLDTVDSVEILIREQPERATEFEAALLELVKALRTAYPEALVVMNRGFRFLPLLRGVVDSVLVESVYRTYQRESGTFRYVPVPKVVTAALEERVREALGLGFQVYAIDYVDPGDLEMEEQTRQSLRTLGVVPFVGTPELQGLVGKQRKKVARRILCLYGHDPRESEEPRIWPEDTVTLAIFQTALEWMGYEVEYHDVSAGLPSGFGMEGFCGVILDETMNIPFSLEHDYVEWLLRQFSEGRKLLFVGGYGFDHETHRARLLHSLGLTSDPSRQLVPSTPVVSKIDPEVMNFELEVRPRFGGFEDLVAPAGSKVFLELELGGQVGLRPPRFDAVYAATWGGAALSPYVTSEVSEEMSLSYLNPFTFLREIFPADAFPAPDVTTKDGLRILYTHIDGDGFSSQSWIESGKTCAEVLYDRILKDLPWPITVSVVEADIRAHLLQQREEDRERLEEVARRIFSLPHVEPASHSYSHPYVWDSEDTSNVGLYETLNLPLKLQAGYPKIDLGREIAGSLNYIGTELSGEQNPPKIFLWSGNCRPSASTLRIVEEAGVENMNGGSTILSRRFPGIAGVAPKLVSQEESIQIYASNQNEFYYTDGWVGPYHHGFSQVIETFEMTDVDRRLKPVNVYYHFYSADRSGALQALQDIYDWCRQRPLRGMTASEYAKLVRDSHHTEIYQEGPGKWIFVNRGEHTVYRLPASAGFPDLERSKGVIGFNRMREWIFVQTDDSGHVELQLAEEPPSIPFLRTSTSPVRFERRDKGTVEIRARDREAEVELGGFPPGKPVSVIHGGQPRIFHADEEGTVRLRLKSGMTCALSI